LHDIKLHKEMIVYSYTASIYKHFSVNNVNKLLI